MTRLLAIRALVMFLFVVVTAAAVAESDRGPSTEIESLAWLAGHWRGPADKGTWEAIYSSPEGGLVLSLSKQVVDGQLQTFEFEQFRVEEGRIVMAPSPAGRPSPIVFTLTEHDPGARRAVFENPTHDFPQMITYHRLADDTLRIQVHARRDGELFGFELVLQRQR